MAKVDAVGVRAAAAQALRDRVGDLYAFATDRDLRDIVGPVPPEWEDVVRWITCEIQVQGLILDDAAEGLAFGAVRADDIEVIIAKCAELGDLIRAHARGEVA